jgi:hypothetical protein
MSSCDRLRWRGPAGRATCRGSARRSRRGAGPSRARRGFAGGGRTAVEGPPVVLEAPMGAARGGGAVRDEDARGRSRIFVRRPASELMSAPDGSGSFSFEQRRLQTPFQVGRREISHHAASFLPWNSRSRSAIGPRSLALRKVAKTGQSSPLLTYPQQCARVVHPAHQIHARLNGQQGRRHQPAHAGRCDHA